MARIRHDSPLLLAVCVAWLAGCATGVQPGVRPDFEDTSIRRVTVTPFFARSRFSLASDALDRRLGLAQTVAARWLREHGVRVEPPDETERRLRSADARSHFRNGGIFHADLGSSFESAGQSERRKVQESTARQLHASDLTRRYLLFGELLYQTSGMCRRSAGAYNTRAHVVVHEDADRVLPRPCVVSHFQARLVDARTGRTVWFNRRLREFHPDQLTTDAIRTNIRATVVETLSGEDGLMTILAHPGGSS